MKKFPAKHCCHSQTFIPFKIQSQKNKKTSGWKFGVKFHLDSKSIHGKMDAKSSFLWDFDAKFRRKMNKLDAKTHATQKTYISWKRRRSARQMCLYFESRAEMSSKWAVRRFWEADISSQNSGWVVPPTQPWCSPHLCSIAHACSFAHKKIAMSIKWAYFAFYAIFQRFRSRFLT